MPSPYLLLPVRPRLAFVRECQECPFCGKAKPARTLACWACFNARLKDGTDEEAEQILEDAERQHRQDNGQFGVGA